MSNEEDNKLWSRPMYQEETAGAEFHGDQDMSFGDLPNKALDGHHAPRGRISVGEWVWVDDTPITEISEKAALDSLYEGVHEFRVEDPTVVAVLRKMEARSAAGMLKYATTMAANPLGLKQWLQHSIEEKMDDLLYMQRALEEIEKNETK